MIVYSITMKSCSTYTTGRNEATQMALNGITDLKRNYQVFSSLPRSSRAQAHKTTLKWVNFTYLQHHTTEQGILYEVNTRYFSRRLGFSSSRRVSSPRRTFAKSRARPKDPGAPLASRWVGVYKALTSLYIRPPACWPFKTWTAPSLLLCLALVPALRHAVSLTQLWTCAAAQSWAVLLETPLQYSY